jgi:hypothetical protein
LVSLDGWHEVVASFGAEASWAYGFFLLYTCFSALALMNLVTAVVVETSVKTTQAEAAYLQQVYEQHVQSVVGLIKALFYAMDTNWDGEMSHEEVLERGEHVEPVEQTTRALEMDLDSLVDLIEEKGDGSLNDNLYVAYLAGST